MDPLPRRVLFEPPENTLPVCTFKKFWGRLYQKRLHNAIRVKLCRASVSVASGVIHLWKIHLCRFSVCACMWNRDTIITVETKSCNKVLFWITGKCRRKLSNQENYVCDRVRPSHYRGFRTVFAIAIRVKGGWPFACTINENVQLRAMSLWLVIGDPWSPNVVRAIGNRRKRSVTNPIFYATQKKCARNLLRTRQQSNGKKAAFCFDVVIENSYNEPRAATLSCYVDVSRVVRHGEYTMATSESTKGAKGANQ